MCTKEFAIKYARKYLAMATELDIKIEKAFLFGSYSSGKKNTLISMSQLYQKISMITL